MKKLILFLLPLFVVINSTAQTGWQLVAEDQQTQKLNLVESNEEGAFFQLRFISSNPSYTYSLEVIDSTGTSTYVSTFSLPDSGYNHKVVSFQTDTVMNRILVISQYEDNQNYYMHMLVLNYFLTPQDSMHFGVSKSNADQLIVNGGGMDYAFNKFIIYNYRDALDQIWTRGIARKTISGSLKANLFKAGQASNDGIFINDCVVTPTGFIYLGGARKESLSGNFIYFEKVNSNFTTIYEIKDQMIQNNTYTNHVSSIHVYNNTSSSQVIIAGTIYGLAPGDTVIRSHGFIRSYNYIGLQKWNFENYEVRDYKKVIGMDSHVHAVGTYNKTVSGLDTKITRLVLKDGSVDWNRYYPNKSTPLSLQIEKDGSLLIGGDKNMTITLADGTNKTIRSYMLIRYSKRGKRLYEFNNNWILPENATTAAGGFTDIATGRSGNYYASGWEHITSSFAGTDAYFDSVRTIQFTNGALRTATETANNEKLVIRPNPARNEILFDSESQIIDFIIADVKGGITPIENLQQEGVAYRCDISTLSPGMYILKVRTDYGWKSTKFIKE